MQRDVTTALPYTELEVAGPFDSSNGLGNYDTTRNPINLVVIHTMAGTAEGAATRFADLHSNVSAHYGVKLDGSLIHWLEEKYTAYHAGDYAINQRSIGIEHEDAGNYNSPRPDALYATSAKLVNDICHFYNIPLDRDHVKKHNEVSDQPTACPDSLDIDRIVQEAKALDVTSADPLSQCSSDRDTNWNCFVSVCRALNVNPDSNNKEKSVNDAIACVNGLNNKITDLTSQLASLQTNYDDYKSLHPSGTVTTQLPVDPVIIGTTTTQPLDNTSLQQSLSNQSVSTVQPDDTARNNPNPVSSPSWISLFIHWLLDK